MGASITPENLTVRYATPPNSEPNLTTINRLVLIRARRYRVAVRMLTRRAPDPVKISNAIMSTVSVVDTQSFIRFSMNRCPELCAYISSIGW